MSFLTAAVTILALSGIATSIPTSYDSGSLNSASSVLSSLNIDVPGPIKTGSPTFTCQVLQRLFPTNETFTATSSYYTPLFEIPWSEACWLEPACIVTPKSEVELSKIMIILAALETKFATRSGGHTVVPGFNGVGSDGVLIALQNLNKLVMSKDNKTATIGTGQHWGPVYDFVSKYDVTVLGGREASVGVGGLMLGGGLSLFFNTYGLSFNRVTRYRVVLTSGKIVDATSTLNSDLFHALKGGLTNFGVVTEFDLETIPGGNDIYYEIYIYDPADTPALLQALGDWAVNPQTDIKSNVELEVENTFTLLFLGYSEHTYKPAVFNEFYKVAPKTTMFGPTNGTILDIVNSPAAAGAAPGNTYNAPFSHKVPNSKFLLEQYELYLNLSANLPPNMVMSFNPQAILANLVTTSESLNGGNLLNLEPIPQVWVDVVMDFKDINNTVLARDRVDTFISTASKMAENEGLLLPFLYANNAAGYMKPLRGYGTKSFEYIKAMAAKYDPAGIMQRLQNNGFLISTQ